MIAWLLSLLFTVSAMITAFYQPWLAVGLCFLAALFAAYGGVVVARAGKERASRTFF